MIKEYEREFGEKNNSFDYVQKGDRRILMRILYPTIDYDLLFYPNNDNEALLDEMNIPHKIYGVMPYIITRDNELREYLYKACYEFRKMKQEEYNKNKDGKK